MPDLLLIDVVLCAVLIMMAALIVRGHRRRGRDRPRARAVERHEPAADPAARPMAARGTAVSAGLNADGVQSDLGAQAPAEPESAPEPQAGPEPAAEPQAGPEPAAEPQAGPEPAGEPQASAVQAPDPQVSAVTGPEPGANGQGPSPNGRPASAEAVVSSDPIGSYYDEADRPMSDYLAALGWTVEPATSHPRAADADAASGSGEAAVTP